MRLAALLGFSFLLSLSTSVSAHTPASLPSEASGLLDRKQGAGEMAQRLNGT